ncbi:MAG: hypothetical protein HOD92_24535, partial [Deltaproteobacteria bacterium]|nr:hypothetical protein [Deltaproteobacteria bacterium]
MRPPSTVHIKDSIATKLLKNVFSIYLLIAVTVTVAHMVAEYYNAKDSVLKDLKVFQQTFEQGIARALYDINPKQLRLIVAGTLNVPIIV